MKRWIPLALLAGMVGLAGCRGTPEPEPEPEPVTRELRAREVEEGAWPDVPSPPGSTTTAREHLDRILQLVDEDLPEDPAGIPELEELTLVLNTVRVRAVFCRDWHVDEHEGLSPDGQVWHATTAYTAREVAENAAIPWLDPGEKTALWRAVAEELEHLETGLRNS